MHVPNEAIILFQGIYHSDTLTHRQGIKVFQHHLKESIENHVKCIHGTCLNKICPSDRDAHEGSSRLLAVGRKETCSGVNTFLCRKGQETHVLAFVCTSMWEPGRSPVKY